MKDYSNNPGEFQPVVVRAMMNDMEKLIRIHGHNKVRCVKEFRGQYGWTLQTSLAIYYRVG